MERFKVKEDIIIERAVIQKMEEAVFTNFKVLQYLKKMGMSDEVIKDNISQIYDFAIDVKNCKGCKGLAHCNKEPKWLVNSVSYNHGVVERSLTPCKKYLEFTNFKNKLLYTDFPEEWLQNSLKHDVSNLASKPKMEVIKKYSSAFKGTSKEWAFIKGGIATGKSFFAATLAVEAAKTEEFKSVGFVNAPKTFKDLSDLAFSKNPKFEDEINKIKNCDFLVLDDFGNEFKSDFVRDNILFPILSHRVRERLFTIITSNYSIAECASMYQTNNQSKPKIEQIKKMLESICGKEITLNDPSLL